MEIDKQRDGDFLHVRVTGRLDNHWSEPFDDAIAEMIREGAHHLRLDLSAVHYLSSAGIGVLMKAYRDTHELQGSCVITAASERVRTVLQLVALDGLLFGTEAEQSAPAVAPDAPTVRFLRSAAGMFEFYPLDGRESELSLIGEPFAAAASHPLDITRDLYALGVGALGQSFDECRGLFGEFVAAAGTAAYMPTDETSTPDYTAASGELLPHVEALYAIAFRGAPAQLVRFEASAPGAAVPLSEVVTACAEVAGARFGFVMAAEVGGLVCTHLRRSPAAGAMSLEFPAVREWLSYTPEREHARASCIAVGVVSPEPSPFFRPLTPALHGHVHAAVTAFRSLPRGKIEMSDVLGQAFQPRSVASVVHLLRDGRTIEGAGESDLLRGAAWLFPLPTGTAHREPQTVAPAPGSRSAARGGNA